MNMKRNVNSKQLEPILLRPNEAAEVLAISARKLWELTANGEILSLRIGRSVRYAYSDLINYIDSKRAKQNNCQQNGNLLPVREER